MAGVDTLTSKDCRINWELLESIENKPLCDMASCFVQCIYAYNKLTAEYADIKRLLEYSEAMNKNLSEKYDSIESSKMAECERLQKIIGEQEYSIQTLTATLNEISLTNHAKKSVTPRKSHSPETMAPENNETIQGDKTLKNKDSFNSQLSIEFLSLNDEAISINDTVNEINGTPPINNRSSETPTGRSSPIIGTGKIRSKLRHNVTKVLVNSNRNLSSNSPLKANVKKFKQGRLTFSEAKPSKRIDVSHSESFCGGTRSPFRKERDDIKNISGRIAPDDDEIILPSPTSDVTRLQFQSMSKRSLKSMEKPSPQKIMKNMTMIKTEFEPEDIHIDADATNCIELELDQQTNSKCMAPPLMKLNPKKSSSAKKKSPLALNKNVNNISNTYTQYNTNVSLSVLDGQHVVSKENIDFRIVKQEDIKPCAVKQEDIKLCNKWDGMESPQFIYKEESVRKKAEKRKLLGWCCSKCKEYYEEAYKGDEERLEKVKQATSKHRGRFNPEKCATPPGFWDMRFSPPEDTEAFNRQNGV